MTNASDDDMTKPITRGEFKQELAAFEQRIDTKLDLLLGAIMARFDDVYARFDDVYARFDNVNARFDNVNVRFDNVNVRFDTIREELAMDIARHTSASAEHLRADVGVVDEKYKDLPPRVTKLEVAVFPRAPSPRTVAATPKKRRRKAS